MSMNLKDQKTAVKQKVVFSLKPVICHLFLDVYALHSTIEWVGFAELTINFWNSKVDWTQTPFYILEEDVQECDTTTSQYHCTSTQVTPTEVQRAAARSELCRRMNMSWCCSYLSWRQTCRDSIDKLFSSIGEGILQWSGQPLKQVEIELSDQDLHLLIAAISKHMLAQGRFFPLTFFQQIFSDSFLPTDILLTPVVHKEGGRVRGGLPLTSWFGLREHSYGWLG